MNLGLQDATENDASNGSGEENTNVDLSANLGSLKLNDASENHDESRDAEDDQSQTETPAEDGAADKGIKEGTPSDE